VFGAVISIFALVADPIGLGAVPNIVGWKQLALSNVGIFIAIVGLWFSQGERNNKK
jgi:hypothetical protein